MDWAEKLSIRLERDVLDFVRRRIGDLKYLATKAYLTIVPDNYDEERSC